MDELSMKFNKMMMQEMGIEEGAHHRLYDQDTGDLLKFEGKDLFAPGSVQVRDGCELDLFNNNRMMSQMFTYFTDKLATAGEIPEYDVIYAVGDDKIEMKNDSETLTSAGYKRDQVKYADLVLQINGEDQPSELLKEYNIPKVAPEVKKKKVTKPANKPVTKKKG